MEAFCYTLGMIKELFTVDEEKRTSNTLAGIAVLAALSILYFYLHPSDFYTYAISLVVALLIGGTVYLLAEFIRKKMSKRF